MTTVLVFSGVGSVSRETAKLVSELQGFEVVEAVRERLASEHGIQLNDIIDRVQEDPNSLSASEEIIVQLVVQLSVAQITQSALGDDEEVVAVGHSIGELAAAAVAGAISISDAVDVAVRLGEVTKTAEGGLYYGKIQVGDQIASVNQIEEDGSQVGAVIVLGGAQDSADRTKVHTGFPWHAQVYREQSWQPLKSAPVSKPQRLPLALSLLGGFADASQVLGDEYWTQWTYTGVDLAKALQQVRERYPKIARVVELGAHPMLQPSLRAVFGSDVSVSSQADRQQGLHLSAWKEIAQVNKGSGLLDCIRNAFPVALDEDATWLESGLGSADIVQGAAKLAKQGAFPGLKPQDLYRFVTPQDLVASYGVRFGADSQQQKQSKTNAVAGDRAAVVIRAMSCLLPANIKSPAQLAAFTASQGDAVRFDAGFDGGKRAAAFLGDITIEYAKFGLSASEVKTMDPQQALVLSCVDKLLQEHEIEQLPARTGVYIGEWNSEFEGDRSSVFYPTGTNASLVAARVSHVYRLQGPCKVINSACASSLEAVLEAQRDVASGKVDFAIAGGVNLLWDPSFSQCMAQSGFLAPGARCRSFDASADGYVRSEGCGLVLLTRKSAGVPYYAEVLGGASNHNGGRSASITAPSPIAQGECIAEALEDAQIEAKDVDYVECHGTGTKLGDPIEWSALAGLIGKDREAANPCYLASVKSNLGHLEAAAGVVGLIHAALILNRQEVPHMANFVKANPLLEKCEGLRLAEKANVRPSKPLQVAGVSSFGFGGSNVHVVLRASSGDLPVARAPVATAVASCKKKVFVFDRTMNRALPVVAEKPQQVQVQPQQVQVSQEAASMKQSVVEQTFWEAVRSVAGEVTPEAQILQSGVDSLGLTELFLRIEQKLAVEASDLSEFLGGGYTWNDLCARILQSANIPVPAAPQQPIVQQQAAPVVAARPKKQAARAPESEHEDASPEFATWAVPRFDGMIRTSHVGSLPRAREPEQQYKELHKIIQRQLEIGVTYINDGEAGRMDYATAALTRMSGFEEQENLLAPQPQDLSDLPCLARRFLVRSGLITLNSKVRTCNPHCIGEIAYTGQKALERELQTVRRALQQCNAGLPGQAFWTAPSPGTLGMFFENSAQQDYPSYDDYVAAIADALHVEYTTIVAHGFILQIDCPDLAMSRHTRFKNLGLTAWKRLMNMHVKMLNRALDGIPANRVRVHVCWGNYAGSHHRDVSATEVLPIAFKIKAGGFGFETANHRHNSDFLLVGDGLELPPNVDIYPGVIDTCSSSVEDPAVVCERICRYARLVGPERVVASTDCGFSTTAETQGIPGEVAHMKLRALVAGARMASRMFNPKVIPSFVLRPAMRRFYFAQSPSETVQQTLIKLRDGQTETRLVLTPNNDAALVASHIRLFVDVPVLFDNDGAEASVAFAEEVKSCLADGKVRHSPAYPVESMPDLSMEDMVFPTEGTPREQYDVVVVGAGIVGLLAAKRLLDAGIDVVLLEKADFVGGIWTTFANAKSQVNSSEGSYRLIHEYREKANRDHSTTAEVRADMLAVARELRDQGRIFTKTCVTYVDRDPASKYVVDIEGGIRITSTGVILAINDRVGTPRPIMWKNHENYKGMIVDGFGGDADAKNVDWVGKRVVVVGMGAFAVENARTALEHGAKNVVVVARRHGTICPKYIDYINFVHRASVDDIGEEMNATFNSKNMFLWRKLYEASNSTQPETWMGKIKHTGHTISVSDVWFIGHFLGKLETRLGEIDHFVENGVVLCGGDPDEVIEADIVVRCTGFERNSSLVPQLSPYRTMNDINYLDKDLMYLADAFIDDDAFNSFFGSSVLEMSKFFIMVYLHFFKGNDAKILEDHADTDLAPKVDVQSRNWTDYIRGAEFLVQNVPAIREQANELLRSRRDDFVNAQSVQDYVNANKREWSELHELLTQGMIGEESGIQLPYPDWKF